MEVAGVGKFDLTKERCSEKKRLTVGSILRGST